AFLDEVFKASSSILNTILTLMNERRFHNGREVAEVPLLTLFAAANELPEDDELLALHDRFLLRFVVDYLGEDFRFLKLLQARPGGARGGAHGHPRAAARLRGRGAGPPLPVARAARVRAPRLGHARAAHPRRARGAHQDPQHPRQGRRHPLAGAERRAAGRARPGAPAGDRRDRARDARAALMPRRRKEAAARPRTVPIPPGERCWVESDAYDRSAFAALVAEAPSLVKVAEDGGTLVPHFRALLEDVFCLLFKLEPRLRPAEAVAPAAALNRTLLEAFHGHPLLEHLRERTQLDETQAGLGTLLVAEQVLAMLREETLLPRGHLPHP